MSSDKTIALAADHAGYMLKDQVKVFLMENGYEVLDLGTNGPESVDYPDFGHAAADAVAGGKAAKGIIICGTGIGISIAANRNPLIRAALCHDVTTTKLTRQHNDANILALGARIVGDVVAMDCVKTFLETEFEGGRHARRVEKMSKEGVSHACC